MKSVRNKFLFGVVLLILGSFSFSRQVAARDMVLSRTVVEDPYGKLTIGDVVSRVGTEVGSDWKMGSTDRVYWFRLRVHAPAHGNKVVLYIRPSYLNEARLFEPDGSNPGGWKTRVTGNQYPFADRDRASASLGFVVNISSPEETYYLRIKTRSPLSLQVQGLEPAEADRKDHRRDLLVVFFVTSMGLILIWAIQSYLLDRQPIVGWFILHQAAYTLFGIAATGYFAPLNSAQFPRLVDSANAVLYLAIDFTCILFCRALFKPYGPPPPLKRLLGMLPWSFPLLLVALATGHDALAINGNAAIIRLSFLLYLVMAFSLRIERVPSRRVLQAFFVVIFLFNLLFWYATRFAGFFPNIDSSAVQTLVFDGLVFAGLFAWLLHTNARQTLREGHQAAMQLLSIQKKLELEQEIRKQLVIQAQTDYLTGLSNRCHFVDLAESELTRSIRYKRPLTLLMMDIDHFKRINDAWGHAAGDLVLLRVSQIIRESLRCNDVVARIGGEEFGALLPETPEGEALFVAQRVCSTVASTIISLATSECIHVSVSIGLAALCENGASLNALMDEADGAMYRAKHAGRNCVCMSTAATQPAKEPPGPVPG